LQPNTPSSEQLAAQAAKIDAEIKQYQTLLAADPNSRAFAPLAEAYRKQGKLNEALALCKQGVAKHPDFSGAHILLCQILIDLKQFAPAESELLVILRRIPNHLLAHQTLLKLYASQNRLPNAKAIAERMLKLQPQEPMATAFMQQMQKTVTTAAAKPATAPPPLPTATMAKLYEQQGHLEKALEIYRLLAPQQPALRSDLERLTAAIVNKKKVAILNDLLLKIRSAKA
jgi:tetratricopeptide (TPR) repeat protein